MESNAVAGLRMKVPAHEGAADKNVSLRYACSTLPFLVSER